MKSRRHVLSRRSLQAVLPLPLLLVLILAAGCSDGDARPDPTPDADTGLGDVTPHDDVHEDVVERLELLSIAPASGPLEGGTRVTLSGRQFADGMRVFFGDAEAANVQRLGTSSATVDTPPAHAAGPVVVAVENPGGERATLDDGFRYVASEAPTIEYCQLQAESPVHVEAGVATAPLHAFVFAPGLTEGAGAGAGITGELGYGAPGAAVEAFSFVAMTYQRDLDGLSAGDLSNDEYAARLTVPVAGEYRYVARFRLEGDAGWLYCDLDGSESLDADRLGALFVEEPAQARVGYCRTETARVTAAAGEESPEITGVVFAAGITPGEGAGAGMQAELVWGPAGVAPASWTERVAADFEEDADGLSEGDRANDRYRATIVAGETGEYAFAYRFSVDGGASWTWCDTVGNDDARAFDPEQVGALDVADEVVELPDRCHVQWPQLVPDAVVGTAYDVYGRVEKQGLTDAGDGDARIRAELLVGPEGADPRADLAAFTRVAAEHNAEVAGQPFDEYQASFTPTAAGTYSAFYRFSVDAGDNWRLCDIVGASAARDSDARSAAALVVHDEAPDLVHYCRVWQEQLDVTTADAAPVVIVEAFEFGITEDNGGANAAQLIAEVGYGAEGANPAVAGAYTWNATALAYKGLRPGHANNYEYEGPVYAGAPSAGRYDVVVRIRRHDSQAWAYCDVDPDTMEFAPSRVTRLTVTAP